MSSHQTPQTSQDIWLDHIAVWRASKLTRAEYCQEHDLSFPAFIYMLKREAKTKSLTLVPVHVRSSPTTGHLVLQGTKGWSLTMTEGVSPGWMAELLRRLA